MADLQCLQYSTVIVTSDADKMRGMRFGPGTQTDCILGCCPPKAKVFLF